MASAQNKWYCATRAKRVIHQIQHPCQIGHPHAIFGLGAGANTLLGIRLTLSRDSPEIGRHVETFSIELTPREMEQLWADYSQIKTRAKPSLF